MVEDELDVDRLTAIVLQGQPVGERDMQQPYKLTVVIAHGLRNKEIAVATSRATQTVKTHVKAIFRKLNARSRIQAVMVSRRRGILPEEVGDRARPRANTDQARLRSRDAASAD